MAIVVIVSRRRVAKEVVTMEKRFRRVENGLVSMDDGSRAKLAILVEPIESRMGREVAQMGRLLGTTVVFEMGSMESLFVAMGKGKGNRMVYC